MAFIHDKWEKNGRSFVDDVNPLKRQWTSSVADDENVDLGDGTYAPYVWDGSTALFGRSEIDISAGGLLKFLGIERVNRMDYVLEGDFGSGFVDANMGGVPAIAVTENDDHLLIDLTFTGCEFRWQDVPGRTAQDGNMPVAFKTQLRVQSGNKLRIAQYITSPMAQDVRVRFENSGMDPFLPGEDKRDVIRGKKNAQYDRDDPKNPLGYDDYVGGTQIGGLTIQWSEEEADFRTITVTSQGQKQTLEVLMGPYTVVADTELIIFPDEWAGGEITTDADDGSEYDSAWEASPGGDGFFVTTADGTPRVDSDTGGTRWTGIPLALIDAASIDSPTNIVFDSVSNGTGTPGIRIHGIEDVDCEAWTTTLPLDKTLTTASGTQTWADGGADNISVDLEAVVQEILDDVGPLTSGGGMGFLWWMSSGSAGAPRVIDSGSVGTKEAAILTVSYTAAAAGADIAVPLATLTLSSASPTVGRSPEFDLTNYRFRNDDGTLGTPP